MEIYCQCCPTHFLSFVRNVALAVIRSDANKATSHKAKAKVRELQAKAKDFQHSPTPGQGQGHSRHTATVLDQNKTSDIIYLLQSIAVNDKK